MKILNRLAECKQWILRIAIRRYIMDIAKRHNIKYVENIDEALDGANVCFIFTEWKEIKAVKPGDYKKLMRTPLVYDGRNIYGIEDMRQEGVEYYSIGRPFVRSNGFAMLEAAGTGEK